MTVFFTTEIPKLIFFFSWKKRDTTRGLVKKTNLDPKYPNSLFQNDVYVTAEENTADSPIEKPKSQSEKPKSLDDFVLEVSNGNKVKAKKGMLYVPPFYFIT